MNASIIINILNKNIILKYKKLPKLHINPVVSKAKNFKNAFAFIYFQYAKNLLRCLYQVCPLCFYLVSSIKTHFTPFTFNNTSPYFHGFGHSHNRLGVCNFVESLVGDEGCVM